MKGELKMDVNEYLPLRDVVFNTLRQAILTGEMEPGERLMEIQLANKLGVSRTPIREELKTANRVFEAAIVSKDVVAIVNADVAFHNIIYSMTDNQRLIQLVNSLSEQMYRYRLEYVKDARTHSILISEHNDIIRQLADKDVEKAKVIVRQHITNQEKGIIRLLNK